MVMPHGFGDAELGNGVWASLFLESDKPSGQFSEPRLNELSVTAGLASNVINNLH